MTQSEYFCKHLPLGVIVCVRAGTRVQLPRDPRTDSAPYWRLIIHENAAENLLVFVGGFAATLRFSWHAEPDQRVIVPWHAVEWMMPATAENLVADEKDAGARARKVGWSRLRLLRGGGQTNRRRAKLRPV